jgi:hypothetical protein
MNSCMFRATYEVRDDADARPGKLEHAFLISGSWASALEAANNLEDACMTLCALEWMHGSVYQLKE